MPRKKIDSVATDSIALKLQRADHTQSIAGDEIDTNAQGGMQTKQRVRYDLIPGLALAEVAHVVCYGAERYVEWNWLKIDTNSHLSHAVAHLYGDGKQAGFFQTRDIEDLKSAACRLLFALETEIRAHPNHLPLESYPGSLDIPEK